MTCDIDLKLMSNSQEILPAYRDRFEDHQDQDTFVWALGQSAIHDMTKVVRETDPSSLPMKKYQQRNIQLKFCFNDWQN